MARTLLCEIVTPERILYTNEVRMVVAPTLEGEIGILPLHAPLVTVLAPGEIRVRYGDSESEIEWFAIAGGYLQVHEDKVIVLADQAVSASQIDVERARQARDLVAQRLKDLPKEDEPGLAETERDLKWYEAQLKVGGKRA